MMTPTMKNNTTSARSRALGPSSFPAAANAGTGLLLCTVFLIRSPSSSYGSKCTFQRQPDTPGAAVKRPASQGALVSRPEPHGVGRPPQFSKGESESHGEGTGLRPLRKHYQKPLFPATHPHDAARHLFTPCI